MLDPTTCASEARLFNPALYLMRKQLILVMLACPVFLTHNAQMVVADDAPQAQPTSSRAFRYASPGAAAPAPPRPRDPARRPQGGRQVADPQAPRSSPRAFARSSRRVRQEEQILPAPVTPYPPISLRALENLALRYNPTIQAAQALVEQQQGLLRQLTRYPNPTAGWLQTRPNQLSQGATQGAFISQDYVTAGKLRVIGRAERMEVEWRIWQLRAQIGRVVNDVRIRYFEVLGAQQAVTVATELERLASDDLQAVVELLEAQHASRPDVLQAEIHLNAVRSSVQEARIRQQTAWRHLTHVVAVPDLPPRTLSENLEDGIVQFDWQESLQRLLTQSPVLRAQATQVREAELELQLQRRMVVPNVNTQVVVQHDYVKNFNQVSTLVSVPLPIFNANRGNITNAQGLLRQQQQEYQRVRLALADQLAMSFQQYSSARNQVDSLREILPRTWENVGLTTQAFREGQAGFDFLRVRDAEQTYFQTRISYLDALTALHKLAIQIEGLQLSGGLNPTEIGTALQATPGVPAGLGGVLLQYMQQQQSRVGRTLPGAIQSTIGEQ